MMKADLVLIMILLVVVVCSELCTLRSRGMELGPELSKSARDGFNGNGQIIKSNSLNNFKPKRL
jgi:hypothetical protein